MQTFSTSRSDDCTDLTTSVGDALRSLRASPTIKGVVAVVEARSFLRECICFSVQNFVSVPVVAFSSISELAAERADIKADIVILSGIEAIGKPVEAVLSELSEIAPRCPIVVLGSTNDAQIALAAIRHGAKAYIPVTMKFEIFIETLRYVLAGGTYVPTDCIIDLEQICLKPSQPLQRSSILTSREATVVRAIQQGMSNKAIANELNLSVSTAKVHVRNVMKKLNAKNRTEVAMKV